MLETSGTAPSFIVWIAAKSSAWAGRIMIDIGKILRNILPERTRQQQLLDLGTAFKEPPGHRGKPDDPDHKKGQTDEVVVARVLNVIEVRRGSGGICLITSK